MHASVDCLHPYAPLRGLQVKAQRELRLGICLVPESRNENPLMLVKTLMSASRPAVVEVVSWRKRPPMQRSVVFAVTL